MPDRQTWDTAERMNHPAGCLSMATPMKAAAAHDDGEYASERSGDVEMSQGVDLPGPCVGPLSAMQ